MSQPDPELLAVLDSRWAAYLRQKQDEAETGLFVKDEVEQMRKLFRRAAAGELTAEEIEWKYPRRVSRNPLVCVNCDDRGFYYRINAVFFRGDFRERSAPAMVICGCPQGDRKKLAAANHGQPKTRRGARRGNDSI